MLRKSPDSPRAHNVLGRLLGKAGADPQQVEEAFREAIRRRPDYPEALNNLGLVLTQTDRTEEALAAFRAAIRLDSEYAEARANLGGVLVVVDPDEAIRELGAALALDPALANAHFNLSRAYNAQGVRSKEIEHLEEAVRVSPGFARAHLALGRALVADGRASEGVTHLEKALEIDGSLGEARYQLGLALVRAGRREEARRELEASRPLISERQKGEAATVLMRDAQADIQAGEVNHAIDKLRQVVDLLPGSFDAHLALGEALSRRGDLESAVAAYRRALALRPDSYAGFAGLGQALEAQSRDEEAADAFRDAVRLRPSSASARKSLGKALERAGNEEEALGALRAAARLDPTDSGVRADIDRIAGRLRHQQRSDLIASLVDSPASSLESISVVPDHRDDPALVRAYEAEIRRGNFAQVEPRLRRYVADRPDSWWGYYALGYVTFAQKKIGEAIAALAKSLQINIETAEAHKILGRALMVIGQYDRARIEFDMAARLKPDSAEIRYNLGKLFSVQDNFPAARREFERALALDPSYMEAYNALGFALESMNLDAEALENYNKAIELNAGRNARFVSPYVNLSAYYNRNNEPVRALEFALEAMRMAPDSDLASFQAAKAHRVAEGMGTGGRVPGAGCCPKRAGLAIPLRLGAAVPAPRQGSREQSGDRRLRAPGAGGRGPRSQAFARRRPSSRSCGTRSEQALSRR